MPAQAGIRFSFYTTTADKKRDIFTSTIFGGFTKQKHII
jgi:hypothetical protein